MFILPLIPLSHNPFISQYKTMHSRKPHKPNPFIFIFFLVILTLNLREATSDDAKDKEECTNELVGLATCLPYVEGQANAKAPTPDCCNGLKNLLKTNKKCLCFVIKHRNDPDLGLNINATLALGLPTMCHLQSNVSQCPALLHMDPNSPDAQIFYQYAKNTSKNVGSPAFSPIPSGSGAPGPRFDAQKNNGDQIRKRWEAIIISFLLLCYVSLSFFYP